MKQFKISKNCKEGDLVLLYDEDFHYLCHVRREKEGGSLKIIDAKGHIFISTLVTIAQDHCEIKIETEESNKERPFSISLLCCLPKGKKFDLVIRQATEIGINKIIPLFSDHSLIQYKSDAEILKKMSRWNKIITEATQQSGSQIQTTIEKPISLKTIDTLNESVQRGLFCHQDKIDSQNLQSSLNSNIKEVFIIVGPEGGLSKNEINILQDKNYKPFFFGSNVLRAETACLYASAIVLSQMELLHEK